MELVAERVQWLPQEPLRELQLVVGFVDDRVGVVGQEVAQEYGCFGHRELLSRALSLPNGKWYVASWVLFEGLVGQTVLLQPTLGLELEGVFMELGIDVVDEVAGHQQTILEYFGSI